MEETRDSFPEMGSDRAFGFVFAAAFACVALLPLRSGGEVRAWAVLVAVAFLGIALVAPRFLKPLNLIWFRLGILLGRITTPVVMGVFFFLVVTPMGLLMKAFGKDALRIKRHSVNSYWIVRTPQGSAPESMKNQF